MSINQQECCLEEKNTVVPGNACGARDTVFLQDRPTNNLDPSSREEVMKALATLSGAVVRFSHDVGYDTALNLERVLGLFDGEEDHWDEGYED